MRVAVCAALLVLALLVAACAARVPSGPATSQSPPTTVVVSTTTPVGVTSTVVHTTTTRAATTTLRAITTTRPAEPPLPQGAETLVEVALLDPTIRLDIRYATANNFTGRRGDCSVWSLPPLQPAAGREVARSLLAQDAGACEHPERAAACQASRMPLN